MSLGVLHPAVLEDAAASTSALSSMFSSIEGLIPFVDTNFHTLADQPNRAMAMASPWVGCKPDRSLSPISINSPTSEFSAAEASRLRQTLPTLVAFKDKVKVVFVSYGSRELGGNRPGFGGDPKANTEALKAAGVNSYFYVSPEHGSRVADRRRRSLHQFAPLLFQDHPVEMAAVQIAAGTSPASATAPASPTPTTNSNDCQRGDPDYSREIRNRSKMLTATFGWPTRALKVAKPSNVLTFRSPTRKVPIYIAPNTTAWTPSRGQCPTANTT